jgi:hypothetical protein
MEMAYAAFSRHCYGKMIVQAYHNVLEQEETKGREHSFAERGS